MGIWREGVLKGIRKSCCSLPSGDKRYEAFSGRVVAIDVETTGLMPNSGDRVIEVGAVVLSGDGNGCEFHSLVNVRRRIAPKASLVHGITHEMLSGQPGATEVFHLFQEFIGDSLLIAHNAVFDITFLRYEFSRLGISFNNRYVCTLEMCRSALPGLPDYRLGTVYRNLAGAVPEPPRHHRALDDARMAGEIWMRLTGR